MRPVATVAYKGHTRVNLPTLDELRDRDREAWDTYAATCHGPMATDEDRARLFQAALVALTELGARERAQP